MAQSALSTPAKRSWLENRRSDRSKRIAIAAIRNSEVFDPLWYAQQLKNIGKTAEDLIEHYVETGSHLGLQPNPLFCPVYYRSEYQDIAESGQEPFSHFLIAGCHEGRNPHILFDSSYYKAAVKRVYGVDVANPLQDYLTQSDRARISPHTLFDPDFYMSQYEAEDFNPLLHKSDSSFAQPLLEFLEFGGHHNVSPHPLFHVRYYKGLVPGLHESGINPLAHFLTHGWATRISPHPLFSSQYYLWMNPDVHQNFVNPMLHYLRHGEAEGRDPSLFFQVNYYKKQYLKKGWSTGALLHFVTTGWKHSYNPSPWINMSQVLEQQLEKGEQSPVIAAFGRTLLEQPNTAIAPELYLTLKDLERGKIEHLDTYLHLETRKGAKRLGKPVASGNERAIKGMTYYGPFSVYSGLGEAARGYERAMKEANIICHPVPTQAPDYQTTKEVPPSYSKSDWPIALAHVNADSTYPFFNTRQGKQFLKHQYRIGFWAWELPAFQRGWQTTLPSYDEIWVPSSFCQEAVSSATNLPVIKIPHVVDRKSLVEDSPAVRYEFRQAWSIPHDAYVFYYIFDASSYIERKNPFALVKAFCKGFAKDKRAHLLLKVNYGSTNRRFRKLLKEELKPLAKAQYTIIDKVLSRADLDTLILASDCCVSPHRSEGFGLTVAESLLLGKPTIATNFGGTTDFLTEETGFPVDYKLVEVEKDIGPYKKGNIWAHPLLDSLIDRMREALTNPFVATSRGLRGQELMTTKHSPKEIGALIKAQL